MQIQNLFLKDGASLTAYLHTPSVEMTSSFAQPVRSLLSAPVGRTQPYLTVRPTLPRLNS